MTTEKTPLISIGVTAFNRPEMLKQAIRSILAQSLGNFEILIGNDYVDEPLKVNELGFTDGRIKIFNHSQNLGELKNMNFLMNQSIGKYFTWLADDDMMHKDLLKISCEFLINNETTDCIYTAYSSDPFFETSLTTSEKIVHTNYPVANFTFINNYLDLHHVIGCYGIYKLEFIKKIGGMPTLGNGFSPFSDCLLAVSVAIYGRLCFINEPLVFFRMHPLQISTASTDLLPYISSQKDAYFIFLSMVETKFNKIEVKKLLNRLLIWFLKDLHSVWSRSKSIYKRELNIILFNHIIFLIKGSKSIHSLGLIRLSLYLFSRTLLKNLVQQSLKKLGLM